MKRFWASAHAIPTDGGYSVTLDARPMRTPAKASLVVPTMALATAIAEEWDAQGETVDPLSMPVTRTANSAIDKIMPQRDAVEAMLAEYGGTDLLSYRAEHPEALVARQAEHWDPLLDWAASAHGARLSTTAGIMPVAQDPDATSKLAAPMRDMSAFELAGFHDLVALTGSLVLGLAAAEDARPPETIWSLSRLDEDWQAEEWGIDEEAAEAAERRKADFLQAHRFLCLARAD
ncbi:ATP12 family chaperone protein [Palleronia sp. LCG004]|uniref:ATP12 family chaperone protein n=1 Tax=Palleronia sp. LCG004 TaxID=3079304 RepID=UPI0029436674|nr:ATP12 family protein [Palleronia sp. LCG004]WOI56535.1 ATP12 family protein [Palleronia sp. LCG004]